MHITLNNMMPGLLSKGIEFFAVGENEVEAFHDRRVLAFHELPDFAYDTIRTVMKKADATMDEMQAFAFKVWGGMDGSVDIDEHGNPGKFEYLTNYAPALYDSGEKINEAQLRVLKLIHLDSKSIADKLCMSPFTVARHFEILFSKSGIKNRTRLALWAKNKGIIK